MVPQVELNSQLESQTQSQNQTTFTAWVRAVLPSVAFVWAPCGARQFFARLFLAERGANFRLGRISGLELSKTENIQKKGRSKG